MLNKGTYNLLVISKYCDTQGLRKKLNLHLPYLEKFSTVRHEQNILFWPDSQQISGLIPNFQDIQNRHTPLALTVNRHTHKGAGVPLHPCSFISEWGWPASKAAGQSLCASIVKRASLTE